VIVELRDRVNNYVSGGLAVGFREGAIRELVVVLDKVISSWPEKPET